MFRTAFAMCLCLSAATGAAFVDGASDSTEAHTPLFGVGGWSTDGAALVYDRTDIWRVDEQVIAGEIAARYTPDARSPERVLATPTIY